MSLKQWIGPLVAQWLTSEERQRRRRRRAEKARRRAGRPHEVHYFHQFDDPYACLAAQALADFARRFEVEIHVHIVPPPDDAAAPERDRLIAYSRRDAARLAHRFGLWFEDPGRQPDQAVVADAIEKSIQMPPTLADLDRLTRSLWRAPEISGGQGKAVPLSSAAKAALAGNAAQRRKWGHYLGATFYYAGEWYWGIDRLHYLEQRLSDLGAYRGSEPFRPLFPPHELAAGVRLKNAPTIEWFASFRSPYTYIVAPRLFELGRRWNAPVEIRFVLPMVMRGLPVPRAKRLYILRDVKREASRQSLPFGRTVDPVGRPTERGLSIVPHAVRAGKGEDYVRSFLTGVWAEGIDAGTDSGLRKLVERAGLSWQETRQCLSDPAWRIEAERNRQEMFDLGLWGVPSFRIGNVATWGQDRLWVIEDELARLASEEEANKEHSNQPQSQR